MILQNLACKKGKGVAGHSVSQDFEAVRIYLTFGRYNAGQSVEDTSRLSLKMARADLPRTDHPRVN